MIVNVLNGMKYVGQTTKNPKKRLAEHLSGAKYGSSMRLHFAIRQFGEQNFELRILQSDIPLDILDYTEAYYIAKYDSIKSGYNDDDGNRSVHRDRMLSLEHRLLVNERNIRWHKQNPEKSKAIIEKMNAARAAKGVSEATRKKLSEASKGNQRNKGNKQPPCSEENKQAMRDARKGVPRSEAVKQAMRAGWARRKAQIAALQLPVQIKFN